MSATHISPVFPFAMGRLPCIEFGSGALGKLPDLVARYGQRVLLVTGARSFRQMPQAEALFAALRTRGIRWETVPVAVEPALMGWSPQSETASMCQSGDSF